METPNERCYEVSLNGIHARVLMSRQPTQTDINALHALIDTVAKRMYTNEH